MKRIMINVDDLGLSCAVNQAVLALAQMGRIHATSFMSLGQIAIDEVRYLQQQNIEIGLHFDLTNFTPGRLTSVLVSSYAHCWSKKALHKVICQQLDAFEHKIQAAPIFVDGHQHIHQFPQIRQILLAEIQQRYGKQVGIRCTYPIQSDFKAQLIYRLGGKQLRQYLTSQHWLFNAAFGGVYNFNADPKLLLNLWHQWFMTAIDRTIIMCHPAKPDTNWVDEIKSAREQEWRWLTSSAFAECWQQALCTSWQWADCINI